MTEILKQIGVILFVGSLFSALGIIIQNWLVKNGIVRPNKGLIIPFAFAMIIIKQLWYEKLSWVIWCIFVILGLTLGIHRGDLWTTMQRGSWWWRDQKKRS